MLSSKPVFTKSEIQHREQLLTECFRACDIDGNGLIDGRELEMVARCFNSNANVDQEVKVILGKLDKNQDSVIDLREWISVLFDMFRFMNLNAFDKHCEDLIGLMKRYQDGKGSGNQQGNSNTSNNGNTAQENNGELGMLDSGSSSS